MRATRCAMPAPRDRPARRTGPGGQHHDGRATQPAKGPARRVPPQLRNRQRGFMLRHPLAGDASLPARSGAMATWAAVSRIPLPPVSEWREIRRCAARGRRKPCDRQKATPLIVREVPTPHAPSRKWRARCAGDSMGGERRPIRRDGSLPRCPGATCSRARATRFAPLLLPVQLPASPERRN